MIVTHFMSHNNYMTSQNRTIMLRKSCILTGSLRYLSLLTAHCHL